MGRYFIIDNECEYRSAWAQSILIMIYKYINVTKNILINYTVCLCVVSHIICSKDFSSIFLYKIKHKKVFAGIS